MGELNISSIKGQSLYSTLLIWFIEKHMFNSQRRYTKSLLTSCDLQIKAILTPQSIPTTHTYLTHWEIKTIINPFNWQTQRKNIDGQKTDASKLFLNLYEHFISFDIGHETERVPWILPGSNKHWLYVSKVNMIVMRLNKKISGMLIHNSWKAIYLSVSIWEKIQVQNT